jgi:hypothetical protein
VKDAPDIDQHPQEIGRRLSLEKHLVTAK